MGLDSNGDGDGDGDGDVRVLCDCTCSFCGSVSLPFAVGGRKRKIVEVGEEVRYGWEADVARVEIENEAAALREAIRNQQHAIRELHSDLEEERAAAATAASEAMTMILRVQCEKAEAQMDARQFKFFAEEKMARDQQEIALLEDLLFQREESVESLSCEIQAYRHRLLSIGFSPFLSEPCFISGGDNWNRSGVFPENATISQTAEPENKYSFGDTPREHLHCNTAYAMEKDVPGRGYMPRRQPVQLSMDSFGSSFQKELCKKEFSSASDTGCDCKDDISDRVYTIDAVRGVDWTCHDQTSTPMAVVNRRDSVGLRVDDAEIKRLHMRLHALEADRESMRQEFISMGMDEAQVVVFKEIAQKLCKEVTPVRRIKKKSYFAGIFLLISAIKKLASIFFWRKKVPRTKYNFGLSSHNVGLLILLENSQRTKPRPRRCITRVQR